MKKKYIIPVVSEVYNEALLDHGQQGTIQSGGDTEYGHAKFSNVIVWNDEDNDNVNVNDTWGYNGF